MNTADTTPERRVHILIAEDSPTQAQQLKHTLERHGYQVTTTVNGRQAMEAARTCKPTLVISDVVMPEMNGYQLCQAIKADSELKNIPVILVTTLADPQDVIRGLECRADNFIIKPYDEHYLLSRIQFVKLNDEMHHGDHDGTAAEIHFNGQRHLITADRLQILNLLLSTYEAAIQKNQELSRAKDSLRMVNESLQTSNADLEAFSYSVSHDLRAPLRSISGFSRILAEECAAQLDENGKELLQRVQSACHRMEELIEALLNFSRVARSEMNRQEVDLSALATAVIVDLQKAQPEREVDCRIAKGLSATGSASLLRSVFENLLGNAWKFTSKRPSAAIEVGMNINGNERVFFVRDNGVGFDMQYAERLFGAFQRLHSTSDFPGTGVGLATVQRIIRRHGGRIWAESAVDAGATFRFTL
jgi:signal transduction histidine kinase